MKKKVAIILVGSFLFMLAIYGLLKYSSHPDNGQSIFSRPRLPAITRTAHYSSFEDILMRESTSDVVIARYIRSRRFGKTLVEFEFEVVDRVFGSAADRIFIYTQRDVETTVIHDSLSITYSQGDLSFTRGTSYLLPLQRLAHPHANTHEDGFVFLNDIVVDLDAPANSTMYHQPLAKHSEGLDFNDETVTREGIISYIEKLTRDKPPARDLIRSMEMEDIIKDSPYVWVVEITELDRLSSDVPHSDWMSTDLYYVRIVQDLKGEADVADELIITFGADTVQLGEQHIVAVEPLEEGAHHWFVFTSRNSLFSMDDLDEIMEIIENE